MEKGLDGSEPSVQILAQDDIAGSLFRPSMVTPARQITGQVHLLACTLGRPSPSETCPLLATPEIAPCPCSQHRAPPAEFHRGLIGRSSTADTDKDLTLI